MSSKIPVILDTDIGSDIDDTWALAMLLNSPELDLKLVVTDTGDTTHRAKIAAKLLEIANRTDVAVGIGLPLPQDGRTNDERQGAWIAGYDLSAYPGKVYQDGVGALIDTIMASPEPVTLICIGPVPNIAAALEREPRIAQNARFVGMHGSVLKGYNGSDEIAAEYNVKMYPEACQKAFMAPWDVTITPVDTCGLVQLRGEKFKAVRESSKPLPRAVIDNYFAWAKTLDWPAEKREDLVESSTLFDTVAVYLAFSEDLLAMETVPLRVDGEGYTRIDPSGKPVRCALEWKDLSAFEDLLVERLLV